MKKVMLFVVIAAISVGWSALLAQKSKTDPLPEFTVEEQLELRNAEIDTIQLANQASQVNAAFQQAQTKQRDIYNALVAKYKLDLKKVTVCDGPSAGACADVKPHEIIPRPIPVKAAKDSKPDKP